MESPQWWIHQSGKKQKTSSVNPGHSLSSSCGLPPVRELLVDGPLYFAIIRHVEGKQQTRGEGGTFLQLTFQAIQQRCPAKATLHQKMMFSWPRIGITGPFVAMN